MFDLSRGFGFIAPDGGAALRYGSRIFVHVRDFEFSGAPPPGRGLQVNDRVSLTRNGEASSTSKHCYWAYS